MPIYSEKVMDHFLHPRNVGEIESPDGVGEVGNPICGDIMSFYVKVKDDRLEDVKFKTFGCGAAIAVSSMISEMAKGKTLDEAMAMSNQVVVDELGGLPKKKLHCSNLGADALHKAIENYRGKERTPVPGGRPAPKAREEGQCCPYCAVVLSEEGPYCKKCSATLRRCVKCKRVLSPGEEKCLSCGADQERL